MTVLSVLLRPVAESRVYDRNNGYIRSKTLNPGLYKKPPKNNKTGALEHHLTGQMSEM